MRIKTLKIALIALLTFSLINCSKKSGKSKEDTNNSTNIVAKGNSDIKRDEKSLSGGVYPSNSCLKREMWIWCRTDIGG